MELGAGRFTYIPMWKDNRSADPEEQLSVRCTQLRGRDLLTWASSETIDEWITEKIDQAGDVAKGLKVEDFVPDVSRMIWRVCTHTDSYRNFVFGGEVETDPFSIFLQLPMPSDADGQTENLLFELFAVLTATAALSEDEAKNFAGRFDGNDIQQIVSAPSASTESDQ